jgi:hypothetical protein
MPLNFDPSNIDINLKSSQPRNTGRMTQDQCDNIVQNLTLSKKFKNDNDTMTAISGLCQIGGTNRAASAKVTFTYASITLSAEDLNNAIKKETSNGTIRQFARTMCNTIYDFAQRLNEPGDLSRQMRIEYPDMTMEEAIWCSNFQTQNPNCPQRVQKWLKDNFQNRFKN